MMDWTRNVLDILGTKSGAPVHIPLNRDVLMPMHLLPSWQELRGSIFSKWRHPWGPVLSIERRFKPALNTAAINDF